jgi:hypothetical protein
MYRLLLTLVAMVALSQSHLIAQTASPSVVRYRGVETKPVGTAPVASPATGPQVTIIRSVAPEATPAPVLLAGTNSQHGCMPSGCETGSCRRGGLFARLGAWFCFQSKGCKPCLRSACHPPLYTYFLRDCAYAPSACCHPGTGGAVNPPYQQSVFPVGHFYGVMPTGMPGHPVGCCPR